MDTDAGNNHMEVEETLPVNNRTADQDNMDVEILQHTSRQISNNEPIKTGYNPSNRSPPTGNDTQDSDADSLGSDWDHDGAPTYDHELRRPKGRTEKGANNFVTQKEFPTKAKKRSKAPLPLRRSKSCCNFAYTPITKNKHPSNLMRIATFNVNGLAGSEAAVHKAWKVLGIDILCLVETWLRPTNEVYIGLPHEFLSLEAPKSGRPHGGIVFLRRRSPNSCFGQVCDEELSGTCGTCETWPEWYRCLHHTKCRTNCNS